jgi:uncharacterized repeat protein (TIGR01451 family)
MSACRAWFLLPVVLAAAGCASGPGGRSGATGIGSFLDPDPKASRLEVTASQTAAPLGSQVVLVATVYDRDGQPRRTQRVEWLLEGPGSIVAADESGLFTRGRKLDLRSAVGYTGSAARTASGGANPKDDVALGPGQTFVVISSATPGETTVTARAPDVPDWDRGRAVARVVWGEGRFTFPEPATARAGTEHALTTTVTRFESDGDRPANYRVRYKVLDADGPPAALIGPGGSGTGAKEADAVVDQYGEATVRLVQPAPRPGPTRVAVEVVRPPQTGGGPGVVVGRREVVIEWASPEVQLAVAAPPAAPPAGAFPVTVSLTNVGRLDTRAVRVRVNLSDGATLARSDPPPTRQDAAGLHFDLPPVAAGQKQELTLQVQPARVGAVTVTAAVVTDDGLAAEHRATTRVEPGQLRAVAEAPSLVLAGDRVPVRVAVTNAGPVAARNVTVWTRFDTGLAHASGQNPVELSAGDLAPGETKAIDLLLTAKATGRHAVRASATADGNASATADPVAVEVRRAGLTVAVAGPRLAYLDQEFAWTVTIGNRGDATLSNVTVRAILPTEVRLKEASDGGRPGPASVEWSLGTLQPGEQRTLRLTVTGTKLADRATLTAVALGDVIVGEPARPVGDPVEGRGEAAVAVIGTPAVAMELVTPAGPIEAGKRAAFKVRVRNTGTVSARNIEVAAFAPPELTVTRGTGPTDAQVEGEGKVVFGRLDELRPGQVVAYTLEVEAARAGDGRFRAEVRAAHLTNPLTEEQAARIVGR